MKTTFKQGQKVRIKKTAAAKKLLDRVWLPPTIGGILVEVVALNDRSFGTPAVKCHRVASEKLRDEFWVPPGALEAV